MNRLLVTAAGLCLVLGAVLGVWGWNDREASRGRIVATEVDERDPGMSAFGHDPGAFEVTCRALASVATLDMLSAPPALLPPDEGPMDEDPDERPPVTVSPEDRARGALLLLDLDTIRALPPLADDEQLMMAMTGLRHALQRALDTGDDPTADEDVRAASQQLRSALARVC